MKDNISYELRNRVVEEHLHCIDAVIRRNWTLSRAARLERDDVYQQLALRLIHCVDSYNPQKGKLKQHIFARLKYELLNCKESRRLTGISGVPKDFRAESIIHIDVLAQDSRLYQEFLAA